MTYKYLLLPALMAASSLTIAADAIEDQLDILENELRILKSQSESSQAQAIRFNGFFSVGATSASNNLGYAGSNNRYDFEELTKLGLQASFEVDDSTSVTTQILGKGTDDFDAKMEWAYVSHTFENDNTVRAGKLRIPFFTYSDFLDVGIAQPWARPPLEVYSAPFSSYLGIDYGINMELDDSILDFQFYGGQGDLPLTTIDTIAGAVISWSTDTLTLRATYSEADLTGKSGTIGTTFFPEGTVAVFYGLGATYDNSQLLIIGEVTQVNIDGIFPNTDAAYVTLGYRIDKWLPYITFATEKTTDDARRRPVDTLDLSLQKDAYSLGTKYNLASNMSIKADVTYIDNFGDTAGVSGQNANRAYNNSTVYSIRLDTVF